jgi:hypothetical protein
VDCTFFQNAAPSLCAKAGVAFNAAAAAKAQAAALIKAAKGALGRENTISAV